MALPEQDPEFVTPIYFPREHKVTIPLEEVVVNYCNIEDSDDYRRKLGISSVKTVEDGETVVSSIGVDAGQLLTHSNFAHLPPSIGITIAIGIGLVLLAHFVLIIRVEHYQRIERSGHKRRSNIR